MKLDETWSYPRLISSDVQENADDETLRRVMAFQPGSMANRVYIRRGRPEAASFAAVCPLSGRTRWCAPTLVHGGRSSRQIWPAGGAKKRASARRRSIVPCRAASTIL